jgi:hypothetical protein
MFWKWAATLSVCVASLIPFVVVQRMRIQAQRKRREAMERVASEVGFSSSPVTPEVEKELRRFALLRRRGGLFKNAFRQSAAGCERLLFDFYLNEGKVHTEQTVAAFRWLNAAIPQFQLEPENWRHRLEYNFGYRGINFEHFPQFSQRYVLGGADETAVRTWFTPTVLVFFENLPKEQDRTVEAAGRWVVIYRPTEKVVPEQLWQFLQQTSAVASAVCGQALRSH